MRYKEWHTCKVVASAGGLTIGYVDDNPSVWDGDMHVLQPGNEFREPLPEFSDYKLVKGKWVKKPTPRKAKKRANGEGSITKRSDGTWQASALIGWDIVENCPKRVYFYGKTQGEVKDKLRDAIHKKEREGGYNEPSRLYLGEWLDIWYNEYAKPQLKPTTWDGYGKWIKNHIKPELGGTLLRELEPTQIQRFYNRKLTEKPLNGRGDTLSAKSIKQMHIVISQCLEQAVFEGKIFRNPAKATKPPKWEEKEAVFLTEKQIKDFMKNIADDRWFSSFFTVMGSGLRLGELCALKWSNVDLENGVIHVKESVVRIKSNSKEGPKTKLIIQTPKTKSSIRVIPVPAEVVTELKRWEKRRKEEMLRIGRPSKELDGFVFARIDGKMIDPGSLSRHFLELMRDNGLKGIHFHTMRHSYASLLLKAGEHPKVVQELLGHSSIQTTMDIYSHVDPEIKVKAARSINSVFKMKRPSSAKEG